MKILIVDDSSTMRRVLEVGISKVLQEKNATILHAENGKVGLEVIAQNLDIDYIFLDVNMPIMKGDEMLKIMRQDETMKNIKVIMQTTENADNKVSEFYKMKISGYLLKPYSVEVIATLMHKIIEKEATVA